MKILYKHILCVGILIMLTSLTVYTQPRIKNRGLLQQEYISTHFIDLQFQNSGPLKINSTKSIDSLFTAINNKWAVVAADTLNKYKLDISLKDFKHIDAYCYLWTLSSISQNLNLPLEFKKHLVLTYMIPAMQNDYATLKQRPDLNTLQLIHTGTLHNTLAIGSGNGMDKETVQRTYQLYVSFSKILKALSSNADTAISNYAKIQLNGMERFKYDLNAKINYYKGNNDESLNDVLKGLSINNYPGSRIFYIAKMLLNEFIRTEKKDKSLLLLDALVLNTTSDNISKDTLLNWYVRVDPLNGEKEFNDSMRKTSGSSFKNAGKTIDIPENWNCTVNKIDSKRINNVKYFLIDVWHTACGPCIFEIPDLNVFCEKIKNRDDIQFISINTDFFNTKLDEAYVLKRSEELDIKFPVVYDDATSNMMDKLSVRSFPSKFIIDNTGRIITKIDNSPITLKAFEVFVKELK